MRICYRGNRDKFCRKGQRGAELNADEDNERDIALLNKTVELLERVGYTVTSGIVGWAWIDLSDREEYDELLPIYKECKKAFKGLRK